MRGDAGKLWYLTRAGFFVAAFYVACFANFQRGVAIDFDTVTVLYHAAHALAICTIG